MKKMNAISVRFDREDWEVLRGEAKKGGRSISAQARVAVKDWIGRRYVAGVPTGRDLAERYVDRLISTLKPEDQERLRGK